MRGNSQLREDQPHWADIRSSTKIPSSTVFKEDLLPEKKKSFFCELLDITWAGWRALCNNQRNRVLFPEKKTLKKNK